MKKKIALLSALITLSGCTAPAPSGEETITAAPITSVEQTTVGSAPKTEAVTTTTFIPSEEIKLSPIPSENKTEVMFCEASDLMMIENEADFLNKEHLSLARKICWESDYAQKEIKRYNEFFSDDDTFKPVESDADFSFRGGFSYDFDTDGEEESIALISYTPQWYIGNTMCIYIDDAVTEIFSESGGGCKVSSYKFSDKELFQITLFSGGTAFWGAIYDFSGGAPVIAAGDYNASGAFHYRDGVFYRYVKAELANYPVIRCSDGVFRTLEAERITSSDFIVHVENGEEYLNSLKAEGKEITELYTRGYYSYLLKYIQNGRENEIYLELSDNDRYSMSYSYITDEHKITEESICGVDIWSLTEAKEKEPDLFPDEKLKLNPIPSGKETEVLFCNVIEGFETENEADFPNKEHLSLAREICWADGTAQKAIKEYNERVRENGIEEIDSAEDMRYRLGYHYDFDTDGEEESIITIGYIPDSAIDGGICIYIDGDNAEILYKDYAGCMVKVLDFGKYRFAELILCAGASYNSSYIYDFTDGFPKKVAGGDVSGRFRYENGVFYRYLKYEGISYPVVCSSDGIFRQLGVEKISREDFEACVHNGAEYLDKLNGEGIEITDINTCGRYFYILSCKYKDAEIDINIEFYGGGEGYVRAPYTIMLEHEFTDEFLYGVDVWSVKDAKIE